MNSMSNKWGIELQGPDRDQKIWSNFLKPPFDPFVEEVKCKHGNYLALRSAAFDGITTAEGAHKAARKLFTTLNVVMSNNADTDPISNGAVIEFIPDGQPHRQIFMEATATLRLRMRAFATITAIDEKGILIEQPALPNRAQLWMKAAAFDPTIDCALRYLHGKPSWSELYKAFEVVKNRPNGGLIRSEIKRFTQTANAAERHHPNDKYKPHKRPMELWEARALITQWVSSAIDDILARNL